MIIRTYPNMRGEPYVNINDLQKFLLKDALNITGPEKDYIEYLYDKLEELK